MLRQFARWTSFHALLCIIQLHLTHNWWEAASDVISSRVLRHIIPETAVKFPDSGLNRSREIDIQIVGNRIFSCFFRDTFPPVVASDVISVVEVGLNVWEEFGLGIDRFAQSISIC